MVATFTQIIDRSSHEDHHRSHKQIHRGFIQKSTKVSEISIRVRQGSCKYPTEDFGRIPQRIYPGGVGQGRCKKIVKRLATILRARKSLSLKISNEFLTIEKDLVRISRYLRISQKFSKKKKIKLTKSFERKAFFENVSKIVRGWFSLGIHQGFCQRFVKGPPWKYYQVMGPPESFKILGDLAFIPEMEPEFSGITAYDRRHESHKELAHRGNCQELY